MVSRLGTYFQNKRLGILGLSIFTASSKAQEIPTNTHYELSNHLGNVLATFSGRKIPSFVDPGQGSVFPPLFTHYEPEVISLKDYNPFGSEM